MKKIFVLFFLSLLFLIGRSAVFLERQPIIPGHQGQCYDKDENIFYKPGEEMKWHGEECARKICAVSFGTGPSYIEIQTCASIAVSPECYIKVNSSKPYPECCGQIICPNGYNLSNEYENNIEN